MYWSVYAPTHPVRRFANGPTPCKQTLLPITHELMCIFDKFSRKVSVLHCRGRSCIQWFPANKGTMTVLSSSRVYEGPSSRNSNSWDAEDMEASHIRLKNYEVIEKQYGRGSFFPSAIHLRHQHGTPLTYILTLLVSLVPLQKKGST